MRKLQLVSLAFTLLALASTGLLSADRLDQAVAAIEPDKAETFYGIADGKLTPLEHQPVTIRSQVGGFIALKSKGTLEIQGSKSPVRFRAGQVLEFVIKPSVGVDPMTAYHLRRLDSKKKIREVVIVSGHASPFSGSTTTNASQGVLPMESSQYGASSFKMAALNLPPGEYGIGRIGGQEAFCFGVD